MSLASCDFVPLRLMSSFIPCSNLLVHDFFRTTFTQGFLLSPTDVCISQALPQALASEAILKSVVMRFTSDWSFTDRPRELPCSPISFHDALRSHLYPGRIVECEVSQILRLTLPACPFGPSVSTVFRWFMITPLTIVRLI